MARMQVLGIGIVILVAMAEVPNAASSGEQPFISEGIPHVYCPLVDNPGQAVYLPYSKDCSKYFSCKSGLAYLMSCPEHLHWSQLTHRCVYPENAKCNIATETISSNPNVPLDGLPYSNYNAFPTNCNMFVKCEAFLCPPSLHWNSVLQRCDLPHLAQCNLIAQQTSPLMAVAPEQINSETVPVTASPVTTEYRPLTNQQMAPIIFGPNEISLQDFNKLCSHSSQLYVRYPGDCTKFIQCNGLAFVHSCPDNLLWNSELKTCDRFCK